MDEFIHTMICIHIHISISISTYEMCIASRVARLNRYPFMYVFVMPSCVHSLVCVCACVGVCVFASFTVAVQIKVRTCVCVWVYEYLYVYVSWLPGICMRVRE